MLKFDPADPFPLIAENAHSYRDAQAHSALVDEWLGLRTEETEARISSALEGAWLGLPVRAMLTPYSELRGLLERLSPPKGATLVDLGAGYGRIAHVVARHRPDLRFVGYELVAERVEEGRRALERAGLDPETLVHADLTREPATEADAYFLYDFGTREAIASAFERLREHARRREISVVARGRSSRDEIERRQPWLSQVRAPEHFAHYSIYRS
jgi:hypothetical protein